MKLLPTLAAVLALASPVLAAQDASTPLGQRDLTALASFFTGNWDPEPGEPPIRIRVKEFWPGSAVRWLYVEWTPVADDSKPVRQRVLRIAEDAPQMIATVHRLPGDAQRYAGEWRKAKPFEGLRPGDFAEIRGCHLRTVRAMTAHFTLTTAGQTCPADWEESPFMRFEFSLTSSQLEVLEQRLDAAGEVMKARLTPVRFGRMSREPK